MLSNGNSKSLPDASFGCLYKCNSKMPSTQEYHVYPASASTIQLLLPVGVVCDKCNAYFSKLEQHFIERHPGADERLVHIRKTRKGKPPIVNSRAGRATRYDGDGMRKYNIPLSQITHEVLESGNIVLKGSYERFPFDSMKISRLLVKMSLESMYQFETGSVFDPEDKIYDAFREYARFGCGVLRYVWFAWKNTTEIQRLPQIVSIQDPGSEPVASLCRLSFPNIAYLVPLPPIPKPAQIPQALQGWHIADKAQEYPNAPGTVECNLIKAQSRSDEYQKTS